MIKEPTKEKELLVEIRDLFKRNKIRINWFDRLLSPQKSTR